MTDPQFSIEPVRPWDVLTLTRMAYANMTGVDREFTRSTRGPIGHALGYVFLPLYLLTSGRGYKAVVDGKIVGCAFLNMRRLSGFVYNVHVNAAFRRKGIGRALMEHVEREVRRMGRRWVGLHLDAGNTPAQRLYESLGYHAYHPRYLRSHSTAVLQQPKTDRVRLDSLPRYEGQQMWKLYADLARREGDAWAARQIREDFDEGAPPGGAFWACFEDDEKVGCVWMHGRPSRPIVILLLRQPHWEDGAMLVTILRTLLEAEAPHIDTISLHLGSSEQLEAALSLLSDFDFAPYLRPRILMLKELPL